jgi:predicted metal-dependent phosphoesterase TrpH
MSGYDLHTHTTFSDGTESPTHNVRMARERGVAGIGVTDHDTFAGLDEGQRAGSEAGVEIVPGIEFSAEYDGASLHVLGYWVDPHHAPLEEELRRLTDTRFRRGEMMIEKLQAAGYDISLKDVAAAGGWHDTETLVQCYQQPDNDTLLAVMNEERKVREKVLSNQG